MSNLVVNSGYIVFYEFSSYLSDESIDLKSIDILTGIESDELNVSIAFIENNFSLKPKRIVLRSIHQRVTQSIHLNWLLI